MSWLADLWRDRIPMTPARWAEMVIACVGAVLLALFITIVMAVSLRGPAHGRDLGQWSGGAAGETSPEERAWYESAMQPDNPLTGCCGEADAYWADGFEREGDKYVAIITDERPDGPRKRKHREVGSRIVVPNYKIKTDQPHPDGHGVIFVGPNNDFVYCYFPPGGV